MHQDHYVQGSDCEPPCTTEFGSVFYRSARSQCLPQPLRGPAREVSLMVIGLLLTVHALSQPATESTISVDSTYVRQYAF